MWFPTLTYPVEQPYRIRRITEIFYFSSFVLIALLVTLNVALVGYDVVTVLLPNPNVTNYDQWWAPAKLPDALKIRTKPGECEPTRLPMGTPLKTNSSLPLFTYFMINDPTLRSTSPQANSLAQRSYQANPLNGCRVQNMTLSTQLSTATLQIATNVQCNLNEDIQSKQIRVFSMTFARSEETGSRADSILEYLAFQMTGIPSDLGQPTLISSFGPPNNTFLNILGLLDGLGSDALQAIRVEANFTDMYYSMFKSESSHSYRERNVLVWDSSEDERSPANKSRFIYRSSADEDIFLYVMTNNSLNLQHSYSSFTNILVAVRDAIHLDLGYVSPTNIFINRTAFEYAIKTDDRIEAMRRRLLGMWFPDNNYFRSCSWAWGCIKDVDATWAEKFSSSSEPLNNITLPISPESPIYPSVINMDYLCPQYRRKSWGSLIVSVFIGTFTMYATLYQIFNWVAPKLDERAVGRQPQESLKHTDEEKSVSKPLLEDLSFVSTPFIPENSEEHLVHDSPDRRASAE
ncbi:hypothetical protein BDV93DRAFT_542333 [Ceratobasidium sp. AG-I]|nr:hypothetical protein BDV93DRAFT_542333 [Ceratobasidium sp. AG-I]